MKYLLRYGVTTLIALVIGLGFVWYTTPEPPEPPPKIYYALYQFVWSEHAVTARTSSCGETLAGNYYFWAIDPPKGFALFDTANLRFGLCLDDAVPESPMGVPHSPMNF